MPDKHLLIPLPKNYYSLYCNPSNISLNHQGYYQRQGYRYITCRKCLKSPILNRDAYQRDKRVIKVRKIIHDLNQKLAGYNEELSNLLK